MEYKYYSLSSLRKLNNDKSINFFKKLEVISLVLRLNILYSIQRAGSGHLGSSLSALDIFLCCSEFLKTKKGIFFSSKGHDAPALYNVMAFYNKLNFKKIHLLRRINGLPGHPDINKTKNILFNTGSLGMGVSKINGLCYSNFALKEKDRNIVVIGDGELQEGQNWEAFMFLQNNKNLSPLIIIDSNKVQSDTWVKHVKDYSNLKNKIKSFKLNFKEVDGHNKKKLLYLIEQHFIKKNGATIILANTIKGKGFNSFESSQFSKNMKFYPYHSGSLPLHLYEKASNELINKVSIFCTKNNIQIPKIKNEKIKIKKNLNEKSFSLIETYSKELFLFAKKNKRVIVLDADLTKDAGSSEVMMKLPGQFIEFGIAEQDMVSFGSGLAAKKFLPIFHSFSSFLSTRAQEQIFNFCSENRKGIFIGALSGLTPSAPGHSHQMLRDIPLIGSIPNMILLEIFSKIMIKNFFKTQKKIKKSLFVKINNTRLIEKNFKKFSLPKLGNFLEILTAEKEDTVVICQGADVINQILKIKEKVQRKKNISILAAVWLNRINKKEILRLNNKKILIFQSSSDFGSFDSFLSNQILLNVCTMKKYKTISVNGIPACGQDDEVLKYHSLSSLKILDIIKSF
jgi:transketolase